MRRMIFIFAASLLLSLPAGAQPAKKAESEVTVHLMNTDGTVHHLLLSNARAAGGQKLPKLNSNEKMKESGRPRSLRRAYDTVVANMPRGTCNMEYLTFHAYGSEVALTGTHAICKTETVKRGHLVQCADKSHLVVAWESMTDYDATRLCPENKKP